MRFLIFVVLMLGVTGIACAQMTDAQVIEAVKSAQAQGKSQDEIILMLSQKGVTKEQVLRIKENYERENSGKQGGLTQENRERIETISLENRDVVLVTEGNKNSIFGRNLFSNKNLTFEPSLNIPTPENYVLGPGDEVIIDIWGNSEATVRQVISPEGSINVSNIGPIYLNGKRIQEASSYLKTMFSRIYSDLASENPSTFLKVSLGQIRSIQVNVMGEIVMPGTYMLPSLATVFHALYAAGGVNNVGTLRDVVLYRNGKAFKHVDVYDYIMNGNNSFDITLQDGDLINVGTYEKIVTVAGKVKRPMRYEMKGEESLSKLLEYAGGFTSDAYKKNVNVFSDENMQKIIYAIENQKTEKDFSVCVSAGDISTHNYRLDASCYFEIDVNNIQVHRDYSDIVNDINRIVAEKNACKLTINASLAKSLGFDVELYKAKQEISGLNELLQKLGASALVEQNYFMTSKKKNEIRFENNSKDILSSILVLILNNWKQHIFYLNQEENRYLAELRDALLPELMSGKIEV